jgi:hypothetical protein
VSKIKVTPEAWKNPGIREIMHTYTRCIRLLMFTRGGVTCWAMWLLREALSQGQSHFLMNQNALQYLTHLVTFFWACDLVIFAGLLQKESDKSYSVMVHQDSRALRSIQFSIVAAGLWIHVNHYLLH